MTLHHKVSYFALQSMGYAGKEDRNERGSPAGMGRARAVGGRHRGGGDRLASDVPPSAVTGAFGGLVYVACAAVFLRRALLRGRAG